MRVKRGFKVLEEQTRFKVVLLTQRVIALQSEETV